MGANKATAKERSWARDFLSTAAWIGAILVGASLAAEALAFE
jgi:hypothetical protein